MTIIDFNLSEGDMVTVKSFPDMGEFEVCGLHCLNGAISYTINDGEKEDVKYEYQLKLIKPNKVKPRKIGFKDRPEVAGKPTVEHIGDVHGIEIHEE